MGIPILHMLNKTWSHKTFACANSSFSPAGSYYANKHFDIWKIYMISHEITPSLICHMWIPNCLTISHVIDYFSHVSQNLTCQNKMAHVNIFTGRSHTFISDRRFSHVAYNFRMWRQNAALEIFHSPPHVHVWLAILFVSQLDNFTNYWIFFTPELKFQQQQKKNWILLFNLLPPMWTTSFHMWFGNCHVYTQILTRENKISINTWTGHFLQARGLFVK